MVEKPGIGTQPPDLTRFLVKYASPRLWQGGGLLTGGNEGNPHGKHGILVKMGVLAVFLLTMVW